MHIVGDSQIPYLEEFFGGYGELTLKPGRKICKADLVNADMLLVRSITHVDAALLGGTSVKFVGSVTAGADHLDTKWLTDNGIHYSIAAGFNAPPVADYVMSVLAALASKAYLPPHRFKIGIIGVGNVGRLVLQRLQHFGCDIYLCDPLLAEDEPNFESIPLDELYDLDILTLHVPLVHHGPYPTYHFINRDFLEKQKRNCVIINTSRGAVINSADLLTYGKHLRWCFDVWEDEPKIDKTLLEQAFIATPHISGYSRQSKIRGIEMIYRIACEQGMIKPKSMPPLSMPVQQLSFAGASHRWHDIVLGVFNPLVVTAMMRTVLLPANDYGVVFDEMRNQFNYRYEFGYTSIADCNLLPIDRALLVNLGLKKVD